MRWWALLFPVAQAAAFGVVFCLETYRWVYAAAAGIIFLCGVQMGQELTDAVRGLGNWKRDS